MGSVRDYAWGEALPALAGAGVVLRALESSDVDALYTIFGDAEVTRYWSWSAFRSRADAERLFEDIRTGFVTRSLFQWGIVEEGARAVVGTCTLYGFDREGWRCEIGFALARRAWGRGTASRAVATALEFAFEALGVQRVEADADPRNLRSLSLLERQGFQREGLLRERYCVGGERQDAVLLGLLQCDWQNARTR
jgi:[ribosomal protein S5]-alanine N-acetyltransferase